MIGQGILLRGQGQGLHHALMDDVHPAEEDEQAKDKSTDEQPPVLPQHLPFFLPVQSNTSFYDF
jgi:hypothetical protein